MRTRLSTLHTSLWAALGLAAVSCGGKSETPASTVDGGGAGGTGARGGSGGGIVDFGGASGVAGTGGADGASGVAGTASTDGASGAAGTAGTGGNLGQAGTGGTGGTAGSAGMAGTAGDGGSGIWGGAGGWDGTGGISGDGGFDIGCTNPTPVIGINDQPTGFVRCQGGWVHRPERQDCGSSVPRPGEIVPPRDSGAGCTRDQDCSDLPHGYCKPTRQLIGSEISGTCHRGCVRDEECAAGYVCLCGDPVGTCVQAHCRTDADCGGDVLCAVSERLSPCGDFYPGVFECQQRTDTCNSRQDCTATENCETYPSGRRCSSYGACGRPFLVQGAPRLAPLVANAADWSARASAISTLKLSTRAKLAEHWSSNGLMEHASVAAFARFALQLLSLGAPAELIESAQKALGDEIAHTKLCFALASHYAGRPLGPGPLPMNGALENDSFFDIVSTAISEACIGETLAAVEAAEAATYAKDRRVREALETIARDEAQHAELGWKFLGWALDAADGETRARLIAHLRRQVEQELAQSDDRDDDALLEHGVLTSSLRREVRRATLTELVAPIGRAFAQAPERLVA